MRRSLPCSNSLVPPLAAALGTAGAFALGFALVAQAQAASAPASAPAVESTGRIDLSIEPAIPEVAIPILGFEQKPVLVEGVASPTTYLHYSFQPPAGQMFELRLFAPEGTVALVIARGTGGSLTPATTIGERTQMYLSSGEANERIRVLVRGLVAGQTPFKLGAKVYSKSEADD